MSLWSVEDPAECQWMEGFTTHSSPTTSTSRMPSGRPSLTMLRERRARPEHTPLYWASFVAAEEDTG
jgi:hypothetical protein